VKLGNLRHPILTAQKAKSRLSTHVNMLTFAYHGKRRFRGDPRYDLQNVTDGFRSRIDDQAEDAKILERICNAYNKAVQRQTSEPDFYPASGRWQEIRQRSLRPVLRALLTRDIPGLGLMYRNFYRDACSSGILGAPGGLSGAYFSGKISDVHRHFYLSHVLYRLDYWKALTNGRYALRDLAGPGVGNPFGVIIDGTHISVGAEYSHYCSRRVSEQLDPGIATVAEIGGGFGAIAYYLLRDRPGTAYVDFDLPENIALASYYLMKAFPDRKFLCYGERDITRESIAEANVVMLPRVALSRFPAGTVDLTFTSHGMSELSTGELGHYLEEIDRITDRRLLFMGNRAVSQGISESVQKGHRAFALVESREAGWHSYKVSGAGVGGAASTDAATIVENSYIRNSHSKDARASSDPPMAARLTLRNG
jgi:putative sugar O-methyltransferase